MDNPIRLHWLDPRNPSEPFPPPADALANPNGLLAIGGDLTVPRLLRAYASGVFPWFNPNEPILWWSPDPRAILDPGAFHVSRSLLKRLNRGDFALSLDRAFGDVIDACGGPRRGSRGTWLGSQMRHAYGELHRAGYCHSVEVWHEGRLAGGLYGVALGRAFFGESMFSHRPDGSKIALWALCRQLEAWAFPVLDCQIGSAHLYRLGAQEIPRSRFLRRLHTALAGTGRHGPWSFTVPMPGDPSHLGEPST